MVSFGCILKVKWEDVLAKLDVGCERKRGVKNESKDMSETRKSLRGKVREEKSNMSETKLIFFSVTFPNVLPLLSRLDHSASSTPTKVALKTEIHDSFLHQHHHTLSPLTPSLYSHILCPSVGPYYQFSILF